ncbi:MAG TPA: energy-coupling factor ABC transporter permease [Verrucomicrobiae bacterium]|nr:energy-coupling factor ABC transporter permease [Verrucomicrobiae bacterium]
MHMADALISPAVGGTMWATSAGLIAWCARKVKGVCDDRLVPMMGVMGAFIFASQMINFSIPGTGSSGHLGGGLILTILLGPHAAFLAIASVLTVQALFFADGGLLALGCNVFNLGFFPAFVAYPLIYRPIAGARRAGGRAWTAAIVAAVAGLQLGAFGVVVETKLSGISELPFGTFLMVMQPIHLAIGVVEGLATAAVVEFVARVRPEAIATTPAAALGQRSLRPVLAGLLVAAALAGGGLNWFASSHPDGLEWSISKLTGKEELEGSGDGPRGPAARIQEKTAFLPDYGFRPAESKPAPAESSAGPGAGPWPAVSAGTSVSGIVGGLITLIVAGLIGYLLKRGGRTTT